MNNPIKNGPNTEMYTNNNTGKSVEKRKPSFTTNRNANWCSYCGKQYRGSSKN